MKPLFILGIFLAFVLVISGGVLAITINAYDTDAVNYITSNANITINTYSQTWL